jgi:UDP-N-acetyl-D-mannosaminuronic acid dehydrogenase
LTTDNVTEIGTQGPSVVELDPDTTTRDIQLVVRARRAPFVDDVVIVGGCGHVGLPLGIALANAGLQVSLYDVNAATVALVNDGVLPFQEADAADVLKTVVADGRLRASADPSLVSLAEHVIVVVGTPVDEHLNPEPQAIIKALQICAPFMVDGQLLILRSTVYPGVTALVEPLMSPSARSASPKAGPWWSCTASRN